MTDSVVVEGYARLRDGKKWKTRWLVLRKPSPVADCLVLLVFKDKSDKAQGNKERASVTLEEICGLETGAWYEGVAFTLAVLCLNQAALLGFDSREALQAWDARLRYSLGEVHRFSVGVLPGTKLESGPASLHLCNNLLALARDVPPVIIGHWNLPDLRRYGPVPNGFVFEGGTRCGYWAGVFLLASAESEQISFLFDCVVRGISPTRGPFGLRPVLPDPSASQTHSEERLNHEAQELEKRLSMLSHHSSTVSSVYCQSAGGDDRSISGSSDTSDTSQSDGSIGSRLAIWSEPAPCVSEGAGAKVALQSTEKVPVTQGGVGTRLVVKAPRQLQEIGRQSSSDSGIATGSHSSYSGSFSSYTGSLDIAANEEFGSVFSLPPHLAQELSPCTCLTATGHEYQVPTSVRYLYDTPKNVRHEGGSGGKDGEHLAKDAPAASSESLKGDKRSSVTSEGHLETTERHSQGSSEEGKKTRVAPSAEHPESCHICSSKTIVTICSVCGGFKGTPFIPTGGSAIPAVPDQSVDKCCVATAGREERSEAMSEESPLPKKGREKLASLLADLLGHPSTGGDPEAKPPVRDLYESMSPAFARELTPAPWPVTQRDAKTAIYENCLKCQGARCQAPPRVPPPGTIRPRAGPQLSSSQEEQPKDHGSHSADDYQEMNGGQDKRFNGKEERRRADPAYEIMESRAPERNSEGDEKSKYELMVNYGPQRLQETEGAVFVFPPEAAAAHPERPRSDGVTYVNIPVSPTSKKQLNYMELELQEPGVRGSAGTLTAQSKATIKMVPNNQSMSTGKGSTKYAQIDITATETAHKVGTQHALGRQEGLHALELRRKGTPH